MNKFPKTVYVHYIDQDSPTMGMEVNEEVEHIDNTDCLIGVYEFRSEKRLVMKRDLVSINPVKRGRPAKSNGENPEQPKKRGRPRKVQEVPVPIDNLPIGQVKSGRPRNIVIPALAVVEQEKRKPGRPRKVVSG